MDISIRTGEGLTCDYSGQEAEVLVQLKPSDASSSTAWIGRDALEKALRVIASLEATKAPGTAQPQPASIQAPAFAEAPQAPRPRPAPQPRDPVSLLQRFDAQVSKLLAAAEREEPEAGKSKGLKEIDIKALVINFRDLFQDKTVMWRILNEHTGMDRDRFNFLLRARDDSADEGDHE